MAEITLSQHAKERYAERIMKYENKSNIVEFINEYGDSKIVNDIQNMIQYGELIYDGITTQNNSSQNKNVNTLVEVYLNGLWVIIVDKAKKNVITLYRIDLKAGDDVDQHFLNNLKEMLKCEKENCNKVLQQNNIEINEMRNEIKENELAILDYKKRIKMLEESNEALKNSIIVKNHNLDLAEAGVRDVIARMIQRKTF